MADVLARCAHRQAEPVTLTTGEVVACACVECLHALPIGYVDQQRASAHGRALCPHEDREELKAWGGVVVASRCVSCGEAVRR